MAKHLLFPCGVRVACVEEAVELGDTDAALICVSDAQESEEEKPSFLGRPEAVGAPCRSASAPGSFRETREVHSRAS